MRVMCLIILCATLVASAQTHSSEMSSYEEEHPGVPIIENKNINIVVNVNAQELAKELCKIIESRLNDTDHVTSSKSIMKDLEEAVIPLVSPTRRGTALPSAFQVASHLDEITRRALTRDAPSINMLDEEIMTRDIVADMMAFIKVFLSKQPQLKKNSPYRRMLHRPVSTTIDDDNEQDDYMNIRIKMNRKDILDALH